MCKKWNFVPSIHNLLKPIPSIRVAGIFHTKLITHHDPFKNSSYIKPHLIYLLSFMILSQNLSYIITYIPYLLFSSDILFKLHWSCICNKEQFNTELTIIFEIWKEQQCFHKPLVHIIWCISPFQLITEHTSKLFCVFLQHRCRDYRDRDLRIVVIVFRII